MIWLRDRGVHKKTETASALEPEVTVSGYELRYLRWNWGEMSSPRYLWMYRIASSESGGSQLWRPLKAHWQILNTQDVGIWSKAQSVGGTQLFSSFLPTPSKSTSLKRVLTRKVVFNSLHRCCPELFQHFVCCDRVWTVSEPREGKWTMIWDHGMPDIHVAPYSQLVSERQLGRAWSMGTPW